MSEQKKALQLASVASMIDQFNITNIEILLSLGYQVDVVADFTNPGTITAERCENLKKRLSDMNVRFFDIAIPRSLNPKAISSAYKQVKELLEKENYNLLHCHSPIGGVIARKAAKGLRSKGLKVIYTAHGFHFYDGAPLKNWLVFYPIEKHYSRYTDVLITINKEDYKRASEKFKAKKTVYIPGVGVDTGKFAPRTSGRERIRKELSIPDDRLLFLSVDDFDESMNHEKVVRAIRDMGNITYVIVGNGEIKEELEIIAAGCGVDCRIVGFRTDVADFYDAADVYIAPSIRESMNVGLMEAMASSLPCVCGKMLKGDYLVDESSGVFFVSSSEEDIKTAVIKIAETNAEERKKQGLYNLNKISSFSIETVENLASKINQGGYDHLRRILNFQQKRKEIGVPINAKMLLSVGELSVRKNHRSVVEVLQRLPGDYWYIIVGKGDLMDELKKLDTTGRLIMLGFRTDLVELLHCADVFIFPSLQEGLPVALMEAIASGIPCVASRIRGNVDLISDDELLFDLYNLDEIEKKILRNAGKSQSKPISSEVINLIDSGNVSTLMRELYSDISEV